MKILFYVLALTAGIFGLVSLFQSIQSAMEGNGIDTIRLVIGVAGIFLASLWFMRAKSAK